MKKTVHFILAICFVWLLAGCNKVDYKERFEYEAYFRGKESTKEPYNLTYINQDDVIGIFFYERDNHLYYEVYYRDFEYNQPSSYSSIIEYEMPECEVVKIDRITRDYFIIEYANQTETIKVEVYSYKKSWAVNRLENNQIIWGLAQI